MKTCPLRPLEIAGTDLALAAAVERLEHPVADIPRARSCTRTDGHGRSAWACSISATTCSSWRSSGHGERGRGAADVRVRRRGRHAAGGRAARAGPARSLDATGRPRPRYGGLWRMLQGDAARRRRARSTAARTPPRVAAIARTATRWSWRGAIALDAACFDDAAPTTSRRLRLAGQPGQAGIDARAARACVADRDRPQTGPLVLYDKQAVAGER